MLVFHVIDEIWGSFSYLLFTYLQLATLVGAYMVLIIFEIWVPLDSAVSPVCINLSECIHDSLSPFSRPREYVHTHHEGLC